MEMRPQTFMRFCSILIYAEVGFNDLSSEIV